MVGKKDPSVKKDQTSQEDKHSLKGTFISVLLVGAFIAVSWVGFFFLFLSRG